ncbi:hypothetical protein SDRG_05315 [Saprolegnia diclina VS20]|uniref:TMEM131 second Ig-like domain-containing protein n=1 Tax=Saprolegnia diclina (strain VS20) TaxID=1156394 RepID=T0RX02_SAPDV|nr:hypothetical protein SDRG_05315 [Saprolegnia diclina VS20]EQC37088.1 hypothetical protein SDRG_05315 [Saprolegnia diclina VS20]|eukprot:XP_008609250.1 hypothetical protein SDRG_05315 [Saprolegnia diclina VS20]
MPLRNCSMLMEQRADAWRPGRGYTLMLVLLLCMPLRVMAAMLDVPMGDFQRAAAMTTDDADLRETGDDMRLGHLDYDELYASVKAFEAENALPKPRPQSQKVEVWLGGVLYKSPAIVPESPFRVAGSRGLSKMDSRVHLEPTPMGAIDSSNTKDERDVTFGDAVVRLAPSWVDFGVTATGIPSMRTLEISYFGGADDYEDDEDALVITNAEVPDKAFLFADVFFPMVIKPGASTSMHMLFLPREAGTTRATVNLHTSRGVIEYTVQGTGRFNAYESHVHVAIVPPGTRYEPSLLLFNPHDEVLRVNEVFTTEGFLHLVLPPTDSDSAGQWEIPPHATKEIMRLSFASGVAGNFNAFVRIETSVDNLLLPVDLTVLPGGLHADVHGLDFGYLTSDDERHHIALDLFNTAAVPVLVQGVSLRVADPHISVIIQGSHVIAPYTRVKNAMILTYQSPLPGLATGALTLHTNISTTPEISLLYQARRLDGALTYTAVASSPSTHVVTLRNRFDVPLRLVDVDVDDASVRGASCSVVRWPNATTVAPGGRWADVVVTCNRRHVLYADEVALRVQTNGTKHVVSVAWAPPSLVVDTAKGLVDVSLDKPANRTLLWDLGNISVSTHRQETLNLTNLNADAIDVTQLHVFTDTIRYSLGRLLPSMAVAPSVGDAGNDWMRRHPAYGSQPHVDAMSEHMAKVQLNMPVRAQPLLTIAPGYVASLALRVRPVAGGRMDAVALSITTLTETIHIHVRYTAVDGAIAPARPKVRLPMLYPGKAEEVSLLYISTFAHPVAVSGIRVSDRRMQIVSGSSILQPHATTEVAKLIVSPAYALACSNRDRFADCMVPQSIGYKAPPLSTFGQLVTRTDLEAYRDRVQRFVQLQTSGQTIVEMKVQLDTDLVHIAPMLVRMPMTRPKLSDGTLVFAVTHVGNVSSAYLEVENPSNVTIDVGLVIEKDASNDVFFCASHADDDKCVTAWHKRDASTFNFMLSPDAMEKHVLAPGEVRQLGPVRFAPDLVKEYVGRIYLRNSLSHIEPIVIRGLGGRGKAVLDATTVDGIETLRFRNANVGAVVVSNAGELPLSVLSVSCPDCICGDGTTGFCIESLPSVRVLHPSTALQLNVTYTPSCYYTQEHAVVTVMTSSGPLELLLQGMVTDVAACLARSGSAWYVLLAKCAIWLCFALVVGQMLYYTGDVLVADTKQCPMDDRFGYERLDVAPDEDATDGNCETLTDLPDVLIADMESIEAEVDASWAFTVLRRPAVNKLLEKRKTLRERAAAGDAKRLALVSSLSPTSIDFYDAPKPPRKKKAAQKLRVAEPATTPTPVGSSNATAKPTAHAPEAVPTENAVEIVHRVDKLIVVDIGVASPDAEMSLASPVANLPTNDIATPVPLDVPTLLEPDVPSDDEAQEQAQALDRPSPVATNVSKLAPAEEPPGDVPPTQDAAFDDVGAEATSDDETSTAVDDDLSTRTSEDVSGTDDDASAISDGDDSELVVVDCPAPVIDDKEQVDDYISEIFDHVALPPVALPLVAPPVLTASRVRAPPGFSAADADPSSVSLTYSQLQEQQRMLASLETELADDDMWALGPLDDSTSAFQAPLSLFGSSYFTGKAPGFIGSKAPTSRLSSHRFFDDGADLASLGGTKFPFESSKDVFLGSEAIDDNADRRAFGFW